MAAKPYPIRDKTMISFSLHVYPIDIALFVKESTLSTLYCMVTSVIYEVSKHMGIHF